MFINTFLSNYACKIKLFYLCQLLTRLNRPEPTWGPAFHENRIIDRYLPLKLKVVRPLTDNSDDENDVDDMEMTDAMEEAKNNDDSIDYLSKTEVPPENYV